MPSTPKFQRNAEKKKRKEKKRKKKEEKEITIEWTNPK